MILLIFSCILVLIDFFVFEKRLNDFEVVLNKLDMTISYIEEFYEKEVENK